VSVAGSTVGNVRALPLNFNFEIHPFPGNRFDPFVGPGLNRTYFTVQDGGLQNFRDFQPSSGALINAGVDYWIAGGFFAKARIRKMFIKTAVISKTSDNRVESIKLNPWTFGLSTGYRF
jgi:outer membrane protein